jgi:hypothetical protein
MIQIAALRSRLEKQPTDLRPYASYIRDDALAFGLLPEIAQMLKASHSIAEKDIR